MSKKVFQPQICLYLGIDKENQIWWIRNQAKYCTFSSKMNFNSIYYVWVGMQNIHLPLFHHLSYLYLGINESQLKPNLINTVKVPRIRTSNPLDLLIEDNFFFQFRPSFIFFLSSRWTRNQAYTDLFVQESSTLRR